MRSCTRKFLFSSHKNGIGGIGDRLWISRDSRRRRGKFKVISSFISFLLLLDFLIFFLNLFIASPTVRTLLPDSQILPGFFK